MRGAGEVFSAYLHNKPLDPVRRSSVDAEASRGQEVESSHYL